VFLGLLIMSSVSIKTLDLSSQPFWRNQV
jgi:hypothetical protein